MSESALRFNKGKAMWRYFCPPCFIDMLEVLDYGAFKYSMFMVTEMIPNVDECFVVGTHISGAKLMEGGFGPQDIDRLKLKMIRSGADQWKEGLSVTECTESLLRHVFAFKEGENTDPESGLSHLGHAACNIMFLTYYMLFKPEFDDRSKTIKE